MAQVVSHPGDIQPGDLFEDCRYHPCLCYDISDDGMAIFGISLVDGSTWQCSITHCGVRKLTPAEAWHWKSEGPADVAGEQSHHGATSTRADNFSGAWVMNANGWMFTLKIEQKDDTLTGTMTGINNDQTSKIEGKVRSNKITFTRVGEGQEYEGYLLNDDPTKKANEHAVAGIAKAGDVSFGWYATR
jgi:hypothetical protein